MQNEATLMWIIRSSLYLLQCIDAEVVLTFQHALAGILEHIVPIDTTAVLIPTISQLTLSNLHLFLTPIEPIIESFELGVVVLVLVIGQDGFLFVEGEEGVGRVAGFGLEGGGD